MPNNRRERRQEQRMIEDKDKRVKAYKEKNKSIFTQFDFIFTPQALQKFKEMIDKKYHQNFKI